MMEFEEVGRSNWRNQRDTSPHFQKTPHQRTPSFATPENRAAISFEQLLQIINQAALGQ
ncbi:hypothetical protein [Microcoleus sp. herbarium12]|uniref:hypothetical protein n=1 Tax=Microcoleus sp. herbarium12 TaxID=3055437 RepID=UPI002FD5AD5A